MDALTTCIAKHHHVIALSSQTALFLYLSLWANIIDLVHSSLYVPCIQCTLSKSNYLFTFRLLESTESLTNTSKRRWKIRSRMRYRNRITLNRIKFNEKVYECTSSHLNGFKWVSEWASRQKFIECFSCLHQSNESCPCERLSITTSLIIVSPHEFTCSFATTCTCDRRSLRQLIITWCLDQVERE